MASASYLLIFFIKSINIFDFLFILKSSIKRLLFNKKSLIKIKLKRAKVFWHFQYFYQPFYLIRFLPFIVTAPHNGLSDRLRGIN